MVEWFEQLPEFIDFSEEVTLADNSKIEQIYLRNNQYIAIIGYKRLEDFARFTSNEDPNIIDTLEFMGLERVYLTGLKRRAVYRRSSEAILRQYIPDYVCATPNKQCMQCYNCYAYGGVIAVKNKTKAIRSRIKLTTSYSLQSAENALIDEEEFHIIVHKDFQMAQEKGEDKKASIYTMNLIKPNTIFPFIDIIFNPSKFDLALFLKTIERSDKEGYGSRASLLGTATTTILAITPELTISHRDLLNDLKLTENGVDASALLQKMPANAITKPEEISAILAEFEQLLEANKDKIWKGLPTEAKTKKKA